MRYHILKLVEMLARSGKTHMTLNSVFVFCMAVMIFSSSWSPNGPPRSEKSTICLPLNPFLPLGIWKSETLAVFFFFKHTNNTKKLEGEFPYINYTVKFKLTAKLVHFFIIDNYHVQKQGLASINNKKLIFQPSPSSERRK